MHYLIARARVSKSLSRLTREDAGMTTAEYAVGTVAVTGLAGILYKILTSDEARNLIWSLITRALSIFVGA